MTDTPLTREHEQQLIRDSGLIGHPLAAHISVLRAELEAAQARVEAVEDKWGEERCLLNTALLKNEALQRQVQGLREALTKAKSACRQDKENWERLYDIEEICEQALATPEPTRGGGG